MHKSFRYSVVSGSMVGRIGNSYSCCGAKVIPGTGWPYQECCSRDLTALHWPRQRHMIQSHGKSTISSDTELARLSHRVRHDQLEREMTSTSNRMDICQLRYGAAQMLMDAVVVTAEKRHFSQSMWHPSSMENEEHACWCLASRVVVLSLVCDSSRSPVASVSE